MMNSKSFGDGEHTVLLDMTVGSIAFKGVRQIYSTPEVARAIVYVKDKESVNAYNAIRRENSGIIQVEAGRGALCIGGGCSTSPSFCADIPFKQLFELGVEPDCIEAFPHAINLAIQNYRAK